jgi:hypothetical protein
LFVVRLTYGISQSMGVAWLAKAPRLLGTIVAARKVT